MHWTRVSLLCLCATVVAVSRPASAQVTDATSGVVQLDDFSGSMALGPDGGSYFLFDRWSGDAVGLQNSYTKFGLRAKLLEMGDSHLFTELNGLITDQARLGAQLIGGYRGVYGGSVIGANASYDHYESAYGHKYSQGAIGGEYITPLVDIRANGYMPFGDRDNFIQVLDPGTDPVFFGNSFGTVGVGQIERSLAGFDLEGGIPLPVANFIRLYAGTYFLTAGGDDTWGYRSRVDARVGQGANVGFVVTDDERFGTNLSVNVQIMLGPNSNPFKYTGAMTPYERRYDPVKRAPFVQLAQDKAPVNVELINEDTDLPFHITWVDNTNPNPGDGTFENPFSELPDDAPLSDHVLVRAGVGPTTGNITLVDNQHLWGEGRAYQLNTDRLGVVTIPDEFFAQSGPRPELVAANGGLPIVTLANNNEVINFDMVGGVSGIEGADIRDFLIEDVAIDAVNGILIDNVQGLGILRDSQVLASGGGTAIRIGNADTGRLDLIIDTVDTEGGDRGFEIYSDTNGTTQADIRHVTATDHTDRGIYLSEISGFLFANVQDAHITNSGAGEGFVLEAFDGGHLGVNMFQVSAEGNQDLFSVLADNATLTADIVTATFNNSSGGSGIEITASNALATLNFNDILAGGNGDDGMRIVADLGAQANISLINSSLTDNGDDAIDVVVDSNADVNLFVDPTDLSETVAGNAFEFFVTGAGSTLDAAFIDTNMARAGSTAISGTIEDGAAVRLDLLNVQASDSDGDGLAVALNNQASLLAIIADSTFTRSGLSVGGVGVNLDVFDGSTVDIDMINSPANNNGSRGFNFNVASGGAGGSTLNALVIDGNFSDNPDANVSGAVTGTDSVANLDFIDVTADLLAAESGVTLLAELGGRIDVDWSGVNSSISQTDLNGVLLTADGAGSVVDFAFSDGRINSNAANGINMVGTAGGQAIATITNAQVTLNEFENVLGAADTAGGVTLNATSSNLSEGGQGGVFDNIFLAAQNAGSTATANLTDISADASTQHGIHLLAEDDASLFGTLTSTAAGPLTANDNADGSGLRIEADGATEVVVTASGASEFNDNGANTASDGIDVDIVDTDLAIVGLSGFMDRNGGDGVNALFDNVTSGALAIRGNSPTDQGSASDNADDGIDVILQNGTTLDNLTANGDTITGLEIRNMLVTGNGDRPINVLVDASTIAGDGEIANNTVDGGDNGITVTAINGGSTNLNIHDNDTSNGTAAGIFFNANSGTHNVTIANNTGNGNGVNNIRVDLTGTALAETLNIDNNIVDGEGNLTDGIRVNVSDTAAIEDGSISGNTSSNNTERGIAVVVNGPATVEQLVVDGNILSENLLGGFLYDANTVPGSALRTLVVSNTTSSDNGGPAIDVQLDGVLGTASGNADILFDTNTSTNDAATGIRLVSTDSQLEDVAFLNNTVSGVQQPFGTSGDGILLDISSPAGTGVLSTITGNGNTVTDAPGTGINILLDGLDTTTTVPSISLDQNTVTGSGVHGVNVSVTDMNVFNVSSTNSTFDGNLGGDGIRIDLDNADVTNQLTIATSLATNNSENGINVLADNDSDIASMAISNNVGASTLAAAFQVSVNTVHWEALNQSPNGVFLTSLEYDLTPTALTFATTRGAGFPFRYYFNGPETGFQTVNGLPVDLTMVGVDQPTLVTDGSSIMTLAFNDFDNADGPLHFDLVVGDAAAAAVQTGNDLAGVVATATFSNGVVLAGVFDGNNIHQFAQAAAVSGVSGNGNNGVNISLNNNSSIGTYLIDGNTISENGANGIEFNSTNNSNPGVGTFDGNTITNHAAGDGILFNASNVSAVPTPYSATFATNQILDNTGGDGININLGVNARTMETEFLQNTITGNGGNGVHLTTTDDAAPAPITELIVTDFSGNTVSSNADMGVRILALENSEVEFHAGDTAAVNGVNTIDGNTNAGIGMLLQNNAQGVVEVTNTIITNTLAGTDPSFDGSGLSVITDDSADITSFTVGVAAAQGTFDSDFSGNAGSGVNIELGVLSSIAAPTIQNSTINDNGDDGITITRFGDSIIDDITITRNQINDNDDNGIEYAFQGGNTGPLVITSDITENEMDGNDTNGLLIGLDANANAEATVSGNLINDNGQDGINIRGEFDSIFNGLLTDNVITNNDRDGINVLLTERALLGPAAQPGFTINEFRVSESQISDNDRDGIRIEATNTALQANRPNAQVFITDNDPNFPGDTLGIHNNGGTGVNLIASSDAVITATVNDNLIGQNGVDGIAVTTNDTAAATLTAARNEILENAQHGVNLNTNGDSDLTVTLTDNQVLRNEQRGISLVNRGESDTTLTITGTVNPIPSAGVLATSRVEQNGQVGIYIENNAGALNTTNNIELNVNNTAIVGNGTDTTVAPDDRNGMWIRVGTSSGGHINADVDQNFFSGNGNVDFVTESFVATPDPTVTSPYTNAAGFQADPVARLFLDLTNNVGDEIDVTRPGAFYSNADGFKSPLALFDVSTRRRNAQRFDLTDFAPFIINDAVTDDPGAGTTTFAGSGAGELAMPNQTFTGLGVFIDGQLRDISAYNNGTNVFTVLQAIAADLAPGAPFSIHAHNISGLGDSTFRSSFGSIGAGGNVFTNVISDFTSFDLLDPGNPDGDPILGNSQNFTWDTPPNGGAY